MFLFLRCLSFAGIHTYIHNIIVYTHTYLVTNNVYTPILFYFSESFFHCIPHNIHTYINNIIVYTHTCIEHTIMCTHPSYFTFPLTLSWSQCLQNSVVFDMPVGPLVYVWCLYVCMGCRLQNN